jgi:hypothetical protein
MIRLDGYMIMIYGWIGYQYSITSLFSQYPFKDHITISMVITSIITTITIYSHLTVSYYILLTTL